MDKLILTGSGSLCNIGPLVDDVMGVEGISGENYDVWFIKFKPDVYIGKNVRAPPGMMKVWVPSHILYSIEGIPKDTIYSVMADEYEDKVLRVIIAPLIENNVCPNFVKYYGHGMDCSFRSLMSIVTNGLGVDESVARRLVGRSMIYSLDGMDDRPTIDDRSDMQTKELDRAVDEYTLEDLKYMTSMKENAYLGDTQTISEWLESEYDGIITHEIWSAYFQLMCACYAMSLSKIFYEHGTESVLVTKLAQPVRVTYIYNRQVYTFTTQVKVKVVGFDLTYVKRLGANKILDDKYEYLRQLVPNKSAIQAFCPLYNIVNRDEKKGLEMLLSTDDRVGDLRKMFMFEDCQPKFAGPDELYTVFKDFTSIDRLLYMIGRELLGADSASVVSNADSVFVCEPNMFSYNGTLLYSRPPEIEEVEMMM